MDDLIQQAGPVDILVNNAEAVWTRPTAELDMAPFDQLFATSIVLTLS